jgi:hypothetical protein
MATLQSVIDQLTPVVRDVTDIAFVPDDPTEEVMSFPACIIYADSGRVEYGAYPDIKYYHNVVIAVLTDLDNLGLPLAHRMVTPKLEQIGEAIYDAIDDGTITDIENLPSMSYTFQPIEWGGYPMFGFFLTLEEIKIRRTRLSIRDLGLIAYYKLDETSGDRMDSVGTFTLESVNNVPSAIGKVGLSADLTAASSQYLDGTNSDTRDGLAFPDESYTIFGWLLMDEIPTSTAVLSKIDNYEFFVTSSQVLWNHCDTDFNTIPVSISGALNTDTWYFFAVVYNHEAQTLSLSLNNGTPTTVPVTTGSAAGVGFFVMGRRLAPTALYMDGRIDEVGIARAALTASDIEYLYNSGNGRTYPFGN